MAKRRTSGVSGELRKTLAGFLAAAGRGRKNLAWLDKAVRKAGYLPAAEALTRKDIEVATARIERVMQTVATPTEKIAGAEWRKRVEKAIAEMDAGR